MGAQSAKELYVLGPVRSYKVVLPQYTQKLYLIGGAKC
jgi:hypothetical protein